MLRLLTTALSSSRTARLAAPQSSGSIAVYRNQIGQSPGHLSDLGLGAAPAPQWTWRLQRGDGAIP
jgi:hypothetical protein